MGLDCLLTTSVQCSEVPFIVKNARWVKPSLPGVPDTFDLLFTTRLQKLLTCLLLVDKCSNLNTLSLPLSHIKMPHILELPPAPGMAWPCRISHDCITRSILYFRVIFFPFFLKSMFLNALPSLSSCLGRETGKFIQNLVLMANDSLRSFLSPQIYM